MKEKLTSSYSQKLAKNIRTHTRTHTRTNLHAAENQHPPSLFIVTFFAPKFEKGSNPHCVSLIRDSHPLFPFVLRFSCIILLRLCGRKKGFCICFHRLYHHPRRGRRHVSQAFWCFSFGVAFRLHSVAAFLRGELHGIARDRERKWKTFLSLVGKFDIPQKEKKRTCSCEFEVLK